MSPLIGALWEALLEFVFPSNIYCISCGKPIDSDAPYSLCGACLRELHWADRWTCQKCGKPLTPNATELLCRDCTEGERQFEKAYSCVLYGTAEREIIHRFKYNERTYYGEPLAKLMQERLIHEAWKEDLILPVPMYKGKERRRGYNQAALLAKSLSKKRGTPFRSDLLIRRRDSVPMSKLNAVERRENSKNLFRITPGKGTLLRGKTILLVDDVYTTGSTMEACSAVLKAEGVKEIYCITFAAGLDRPTKADEL